MKAAGRRVLTHTAYDVATDEFCRALGLRTQDVLHLNVGPRNTIARVIVRNIQGDVTGEEAVLAIERGLEP